jgi:hypothetical protein
MIELTEKEKKAAHRKAKALAREAKRDAQVIEDMVIWDSVKLSGDPHSNGRSDTDEFYDTPKVNLERVEITGTPDQLYAIGKEMMECAEWLKKSGQDHAHLRSFCKHPDIVICNADYIPD